MNILGFYRMHRWAQKQGRIGQPLLFLCSKDDVYVTFVLVTFLNYVYLDTRTHNVDSFLATAFGLYEYRMYSTDSYNFVDMCAFVSVILYNAQFWIPL